MQELTDSSGVLDDTEQIRRRFAEQGYLFVRGLIPPEHVKALRTDVYRALDECGWIAEAATVERPVPTGAAVREGSDGYFQPYVKIQALQRFHELAHEPAVLDVSGRLLGEAPLLVHPRKIARTSLPHNDEYTPPHQDFPHIQGSTDTLTMWIPIGDCPRSLGGLRVLEGSHLGGLAPVDAAKGPGGLRVDASDDDPRWRTTDFQCGDAIFFSSITVHAATLNEDDILRLSADYRYQSLLEPVVEASLRPHAFPAVPGWDELTVGWTDTTSVEAPPDVVLGLFANPFDPELRAPESRLFSLA